MFWKIYEIFTSEKQVGARKNTTILRKLLNEKRSESSEKDLVEFYSTNYHLTDNEEQKDLDRSIMNRIRFFNQIGMLLKKGMIDKQMLFELIGLGLDHDYLTMKLIIQTHRRDHNEPNMYSMFENTHIEFKKWKNKYHA